MSQNGRIAAHKDDLFLQHEQGEKVKENIESKER